MKITSRGFIETSTEQSGDNVAQSPEDNFLIPFVWLSLWIGESQQKLIGMTDIDFRRFASLLFALQIFWTSKDPIKDAVGYADKLLKELQLKE